MDNNNVQGVDEIIKRLQAVKEYLKADVFTAIGTEAVSHFKDGFVNEGFTDKSLEKWAPRNSKRFGSTNGQKVLSKTGDLADSLEFEKRGNTVVILTDKPYAQIHNEGGQMSVTPKMQAYFWAMFYKAKENKDEEMMDQYKAMALASFIKIEKRQFIGDSAVLNNRITDKILRDLKRMLL
jgi:phage gpG-like protein